MQPNTGTTGTQRGTGTIVPLPRWLNAADAAAALGIAERTLRKRVLQGLVQRRSDAGRSMYLVAPQQAPQAQAAGMPDAVPQARQAQQARHGTADAAPIVAALVSAVERATRAELAADALRIELDAASAELAAARKGWARAHASSQVAQAALAALTSSPK
jgi:hypothetical protein